MQTNTYQALIISNGLETFTVFTYNCDLLNWIGSGLSTYASIGFSVQGQAGDFSNFENFVLSKTPTVGSVACSNVPFNISYANIVYRVGVAGSEEQRARSACMERVRRDEIAFDIRSLETVRSGLFLRDCPCTLSQANLDANFNFYTTTDGLTCFYGSNFQFLLPDGNRFVYRCCYSR